MNRCLASIFAVFALSGVALAQATPPSSAPKADAASKAITPPASGSSKATKDPGKVDLGKEAKDKQKKAAKTACEQKCAEDFPVPSGKSSAPAKPATDPCAGLSKLTGAYQKCVTDNLGKPSAESKSAGSAVIAAINKPKYDACMKKCSRGQ